MRKFSTRVCASLTVEASLALSLFCLFAIAVIGFFPVLAINIELQHAIDTAAEEAAQALYLSSASIQGDDAGSSFSDGSLAYGISGALISGTGAAAIRARTVAIVGGERLDGSCILGGAGGISFLGTETPAENNIVIVRISYEARLPVSFFGLGTISIVQQSCHRAWTGEGTADDSESDSGNHKYVYVTENGTVYHKSTECTHISLSIHMTSVGAAKAARNDYGGKYYACERCTDGNMVAGTVWITDTGAAYHADKNCSGLKRSIRAVYSDKTSLPACSRCGGDEDSK